jgi:pimeloyl-ACP methyl ester carboxylesterase
MERKFINIQSVKLAYLEINPRGGKTIFFFHGNSNTADLWTYQATDPLLREYRLVFFDLPGHGKSTPIPTGDYSILTMALIMAQAVTRLTGKSKFAIAGLSLGGNIAVECLGRGLDPDAMIIFSAGLVGEAIKSDRVVQDSLIVDVLFTEFPEREKVEQYFLKLPYPENRDISEAFLKEFYNTDPVFRRIFFQTVVNGMFSDELALLNRWGKKTLFIYGKNDWIIDPFILDGIALPVWHNTVIKINEAGHLVCLDQPVAVNTLLTAYLRDML